MIDSSKGVDSEHKGIGFTQYRLRRKGNDQGQRISLNNDKSESSLRKQKTGGGNSKKFRVPFLSLEVRRRRKVIP